MKTQDEKDKLSQLPDCAAEFIKQIIKKMSYRRKVRRDVQAELIAHFEDALKDFETEKERGERARDLIAEFGDVKLLAILLRRAKKRCRPLWRTIAARSFQMLGILILSFIVFEVWFFSGKPTISVDYLSQLNKINQSQLKNELNGWPNLEKAMELFVEPDQNTYEIIRMRNGWATPIDSRRYNELSEENQKAVKKWIEQNNAAWREFVASGKGEYFFSQWERKNKDQDIGDIISSQLDVMRMFVNLGIWRSRVAEADGQFATALNECIALIHVGKNWQNMKGTIAQQRQGLFFSVYAMDEIFSIISSHEVPVSELNNLQQELEDIYSNGFPLLDIKQEELFFLDNVQNFYTMGGPGGGHIIPEKLKTLVYKDDIEDFHAGFLPWTLRYITGDRVPAEILFNYSCLTMAGRDEIVAKFNEFYNESIILSKMSPYEKHIKGIKTNADAVLNPFDRFLIVTIFSHPMFLTSDWVYCGKLEYEALLTTIALKSWYLDKGDYPISLEQLIEGGYLNKLPFDPFSGKSLIYKKTKNNFLLYSVGQNFIDDGGEVIKYLVRDEVYIYKWGLDYKGDAVFWPVQD